MIHARKDANTPTKEQKTEDQVTHSTSQRTVSAVRAVHALDQRRATFVTNALGPPTAVILSEGSTIPEGSTFQYHRVALGTQLQHVVGSVQVSGASGTTVSETPLSVNPRCTVTPTQDLAHILVATTTSSVLHSVELQNSVVNVSASTPQQIQTLGGISNAVTSGQRTSSGSVLTQPVSQTSVAQRIVLNSGMSDVYALRITPSTMAGGAASQQIMVLESTAGLVPSNDVTKVHSYSLASATVSPLSTSGSMQKVVLGTSGQALQTSGMPQKAVLTAAVHNQLRTSVKRPLSTNSNRTEGASSFVNSLVDVMSRITIVNKLLSGLMPCDNKILNIPSFPPKPKKMKLDKTAALSKEVLIKRKKLLDYFARKIRLLQIKYYNQQAEHFFLKTAGNMMDYIAWRKKPPPEVLEHLRANRFDHYDEMKIILEILSRWPSLVPSVTATSLSSGLTSDHGLSTKTISNLTSSHSQSSSSRLPSSQRLIDTSPPGTQTTVTKSVRQPLVTHKQSAKHNSISSVYDSQIGSQEEIVERAKQEAYVMQRVGDLRKEGLWSLKRLPKVAECPRIKAHWDYLLEEMAWLATDFAQERKWKKAAAKKCARMITKYFQEKEIKAEKAEREEQMRLRKIAGIMAREIKQFWSNIEKLVEYKQQTWLEEKRKKVLDVHLNFIVDQTEKYSSWLTQGMNRKFKDSPVSSRASTPLPDSPLSTPKRKHQRTYDSSSDFEPEKSETDDEETIKKEEENVDEVERSEEIKMLQLESEMPLEDFLETIPPEILRSHTIGDKETDAHLETNLHEIEPKEESLYDEVEILTKAELDDDQDFQISEEEEDDEHTILEQEKLDQNVNHEEEIRDLEAENEMSIDELKEKYSGAYSSDFKMEPMDTDHSFSSDDNVSEEDNDDENDKNGRDIGNTLGKESDQSKDSPSKEISDIAATAESFQPKGNTLSTTQVYTTVPFLLKHQLREYQHIGLDWLNAMYDKKLNGILADEMGLGKTIQTISILAHLACEKAVWGPHLIVVPTSVMLNWEMEFKKWCPAFKILTYYGTPKERKQKRVGWTKPNAFHVCITSYKLVVQDHQSFRRKKWKYFILDEAQHIKNFKSQRWQMLLNFQSSHRLLLTGTPLQNNLMELWSLMHFLMPNVFQSHKEFREWFVNPVTGMIEGSHEYNESLIKRLHKVLRPFLLRRLKCEVEKQLPKKYEHVVMCRLSKRQRYLYDDFMSQTKTKETLATGNFMSVINILMQLRKVCNHPNMFEERPTISPFLMEGITFHTSSILSQALEYNPFKHISLQSLNLLLADLELSLTAFAAHRVKKFQTPPKLIVEVDNLPDPPPSCPSVKMKINFCNSQVSERVPAAAQSRSAAVPRLLPSAPNRVSTPVAPSPPNTSKYMVIPRQQASTTQNLNPVSHAVTGQSEQYTFQLVPPSSAVTGLSPLSGLTLQLQPASPSTRVQCLQSVIGGIGRMVQTAAGTQWLITTVANSIGDQQQIQSTVTTVAAQPNLPSTTANAPPIVINTNIATATVLPQVQKLSNASISPSFLSTYTRPQSNSTSASLGNQTSHNKPIGRVAPLNVHPPSSMSNSGVPNINHVQSVKSPVVHSLSKPNSKSDPPRNIAERNITERKNSLFYLESYAAEKQMIRKEKLKTLARINNRRCTACPIYGGDLVEAVTIVNNFKHCSKNSGWCGTGYVNCLNAMLPEINSFSYWNRTNSLSDCMKTPEELVENLRDIINRFVFVVPAVTSPGVHLHISHPSPSRFNAEKTLVEELNVSLSPASAFLHPIISNMKTQFPELRLIEYDCGKLQRLAGLLWELKTNHHRVLIFTQMTRMLDILEQFLNYHGHTYLRLDGNTKVEQRQALMERFNADKRIFCFILSTRSGGIGVNLTGADTVIFYDSDWNPTMDAQAQDRCHRIGQTRDVHIYRLISERTIEENILKKANQKRILGDLAIEGGNFTTAFFKKNTIHELFGIDLHDEFPKAIVYVKKPEEGADNTTDNAEKFSQSQLEQALGMAEEESDLQAAKTAHAEAVAELAEFDESIPLDNDSRDTEEKSPAEEELEKLMEQLTPVEKYAVQFLESLQEPVSLEQLKLAEEEIEAQKKDWELGHLKALKEEEERRSGHLDDDSLLFCSRESSNQVHRSSSSRSTRNRGRDSVIKGQTVVSPPKRRSKRIIVKNEKNDSNFIDSEESNDYGIKENFKNVNKISSSVCMQNLLNGPKNGDFMSKDCKQTALMKSNSFNSNKNNVKVSPNPIVLKPFSNPNLVIRTRRASAIEAEERSRSESESELSVPSPKNSSNAIIGTHKNISFTDNSACSSVISSPEICPRKLKLNSSSFHNAEMPSDTEESIDV